MTYSLNTLNATSQAKGAGRGGVARFGHELSLIAGLLALVFWLLALASFSPQDVAWSTTGAPEHGAVANWVGRLGAWAADASYFALGFSVWWAVAAAVYAWLASLAHWMRGGQHAGGATPSHRWLRRALYWLGLALLLGASCALEWSRLYRFEDLLPGHAGGVLGYVAGPLAVKWLGFTGSGLAGVMLVVLGAGLVFHFSWGLLAERLGARIDAVVQAGRARRERVRDAAVGRRAARERQGPAVREEPHADDTPGAAAVRVPAPVTIIEPQLAEPVPSTRVVKERQKPLFTEIADSALPQVDLLDTAQARQESVSADTLEMTSRLIEKKLGDFGVEVTVVAAAPGPVITRYEIEPATGVKGSQIVNLAKDLARSLSLVSIRVVETIPGKT
ncbi:DNA translocase FtsK 4TM domain-containing protein, partial [Pulveribacter sp.]|uniref:DNA translocase FtsK n=1 Tax=Pulveribacter sp. TaxID=2678893 RepID=UPI00289A02BA